MKVFERDATESDAALRQQEERELDDDLREAVADVWREAERQADRLGVDICDPDARWPKAKRARSAHHVRRVARRTPVAVRANG